MNRLYSWVTITFFIFLNACTNKLDSKTREENGIPKTSSNKNTDENIINFEKEFKSKERWLKIKEIWRFLNKVEPKKNGVYFNTLTKEEQIKVHKDLLDIFGAPLLKHKTMKTASDLEKLLHNLIYERIGGLTYPREMMMRMMPPPSSRLRNATIKEIEKEIDVLIKLKKSKKLNSKEISKALTNIQDKVYMTFILNILKDSRASYSLNSTKLAKLEKIDDTIDLWIKKYNESFNKVLENDVVKEKYLEDYKTNNEKVQKELKKVKKLKSKIYALIEALETE